MILKIGRKRFSIYAFDFETHNDDESIALGETAVWLGALVNEHSQVDDEKSYYYSIEEFVDRLQELSACNKKRIDNHRQVYNLLLYAFNLAHEWSFVLPELLRRGFQFKESISDDDSFSFNSVTTKTCSSVWQVQMKFGKDDGIIIFKDLAKIFNGSLRQVAKSFGLETQKGEIDYKLNRRHNYKVTNEEKVYCFKDCKIVFEMLEKMKDDRAFLNSNSASTYACKSFLDYGYPTAYRKLEAFRREYPILDADENDFLRQSVEGGICYATPSYQFKSIRVRIGHIDIHSAHPSSAYYNFMPYGKGRYFKGEGICGGYKSRCYHCKISYSGVKLHCKIQLIGFDIISDYDIWVWDFELRLMKKCYYDFEYEIIEGYEYATKRLTWRDFYLDVYNKKQQAKKGGRLFESMYYKLLINSSYGKLLEKGHEYYFENIETPNGIDSIPHEKEDAKNYSTFTYLPVGSSIPARTREKLLTTALTISPDGKKIVYFDTDSIFFILDEETERNLKKVDLSDKLGAWSRENDLIFGEFDAAKRYKYREITGEGDGFVMINDDARAGGITLSKDINYDKLNLIDGQLTTKMSKRVKGGRIIIDKLKDLDIQPKYEAIYTRNQGMILSD